ncbi:protein kinase domain-containing protein [Pyxidicoccus sp. 3LG]
MRPVSRVEPPACPDENVLASFAMGALHATRVSPVEEHLDGCADCRALVAAVAAGASRPGASGTEKPTGLDTGAPTDPEAGGEPLLREGTPVGPYVLRELLGAGGMGVVYAAEDPRLGRRVALKLLRQVRKGAEVEARARLLREAQAMARLSHPNVIPIFELGTADGRDYLVMERVQGATLSGWLRARERSWREVLDLFLAAGAGLAAAHRTGLVHRDFKPSNVLVGEDGRARVMDFGLAMWGQRELAAHGAPEGAEAAGLTRAGAVPGTPAYMSPEQRAGQPVDARSDQYSFCVALHEALHGERPAGSGQRASRGATRTAAIPAHVDAALARGLAEAPEDRFPSMDALLEELSRSPPRRARRPSLRLAMALGLLALGVGVSFWRHVAESGPSAAEPSNGVNAVGVDARGNQLLPLRVGEVRELRLPGLERVAVGDPNIVELEVMPDGIRLKGRATGATHVMGWSRSGKAHVYTVSVTLR